MGWICRTCGTENRYMDHACPVCQTRASSLYRALQRVPDAWQRVYNEGMTVTDSVRTMWRFTRARTRPLLKLLATAAKKTGKGLRWLYRVVTSRRLNLMLYVVCLALLGMQLVSVTLPGADSGGFAVELNQESIHRCTAAADSLGCKLRQSASDAVTNVQVVGMLWDINSRQAVDRTASALSKISHYPLQAQASAAGSKLNRALKRRNTASTAGIQRTSGRVERQLTELWPWAVKRASDLYDRARAVLMGLFHISP